MTKPAPLLPLPVLLLIMLSVMVEAPHTPQPVLLLIVLWVMVVTPPLPRSKGPAVEMPLAVFPVMIELVIVTI